MAVRVVARLAQQRAALVSVARLVATVGKVTGQRARVAVVVPVRLAPTALAQLAVPVVLELQALSQARPLLERAVVAVAVRLRVVLVEPVAAVRLR